MMKRRAKLLLSAVFGVIGCIALFQASALAYTPTGIHKIEHVVILMQENRSFDSYFGTFRGVDGIPMSFLQNESIIKLSAAMIFV